MQKLITGRSSKVQVGRVGAVQPQNCTQKAEVAALSRSPLLLHTFNAAHFTNWSVNLYIFKKRRRVIIFVVKEKSHR
jgi:hypothetical protein